MKNNCELLVFIIVIIVIFFFVIKGTCSENYGFNNSEYQYSNPNLKHENDYYKCVSEQCGGNTHDYPCLSMCHMKTFRKGMQDPDISDLVCLPHLDNLKRYYECLEDVYNDYKYP